MSKRQRDSLIAEVERHRQQQQQQQQLQEGAQSVLSFPTKARQDRSPQLLQPMAYSFTGETELLSYTADVHPYLVCSPSETQVSSMIYRGSGVCPTSRSQGRGDNSGHPDIRGEVLVCMLTSLCAVPFTPLGLFLVFSAISGFESRQPSHDLMANFPYNPLEDRYNLYPHSLRNMGEQTAQCAKRACKGVVFLILNIFSSFFFQMSCVPASCAPTERQASTEWRSCRLSDGNCSAERRSKPTRAKYTNQAALLWFSDFLLHLRPPLLPPVWSHRSLCPIYS